MRATSRRRTIAPSLLVRMTMLPKSSALDSLPWAVTVIWSCCPLTEGAEPIWPADAWAFCDWIEAIRSAAVIPRACMRSGFIQIRML
ncbi:hypothetical protein D9M70_522250 [compost metagenome]